MRAVGNQYSSHRQFEAEPLAELPNVVLKQVRSHCAARMRLGLYPALKPQRWSDVPCVGLPWPSIPGLLWLDDHLCGGLACHIAGAVTAHSKFVQVLQVLGKGRFLKTVLCVHDMGGLLVVKVFYKREEVPDLRPHAQQLLVIRWRAIIMSH